MTVGEYMKSLSTTQNGATALEVITNINVVFIPFNEIVCNVKVESVTADLESVTLSGDVINNTITANLNTTKYSADIQNNIKGYLKC